jgi:pantoate--beta-alanine ligase
MEIIHTINWMKQAGREARSQGRILGFVPTMGALHEGHFSLIREAQRQSAPVVVSIFVNPAQFGRNEDFKKYPRQMESDRAALEKLGVDYLFAPSPEEMYPAGFRTFVSVEGLSERLEGKSRPGHFRGVTTVVLKLFEIVQPALAFFGRKDAQQLRILRQMATDLDHDVQIVACPIVREPDGLALSSRNAYLSPGERRAATALSRSLRAVQAAVAAGERNPEQLLAALRRVIDAEPGVEIDYAEIVDADSFEPAAGLQRACYVLLAGRVGSTRLIDNTLIEPDGAEFRVSL